MDRSSELRDRLASALPWIAAGTVGNDPADRVAYSRDLWPRHHMAVRAGNVAEHLPGVIVWPRTTDEVASLVRWCVQSGIVKS